MDRKRCRLLNCEVDCVTMAGLLREFNEGVVVTPNVDHLMTLQEDEEFVRIYRQADYVVADGQMLVLVLKHLLKTPVPEKISGSDLFPAFCDYHRDNKEVTVFLLGGRQGAPEKAMEVINRRTGRDIIVGAYSPPMGFEKDEDECLAAVERVNRSGATMLAVGLGAPKQEKWIFMYRGRMPAVRMFMGIGVTIEFEAGLVARAPGWVSRIGMEWFYRFAREPRRLWRRYFVRDPGFFRLVLQQKRGRYKDPFGPCRP